MRDRVGCVMVVGLRLAAKSAAQNSGQHVPNMDQHLVCWQAGVVEECRDFTNKIFGSKEEDRQEKEEWKMRESKRKTGWRVGRCRKVVLLAVDDRPKSRSSQCGLDDIQNVGRKME